MTVALETDVETVCLIARSESASRTLVASAMPYDASTLPSPATLTYVAGPGQSGDVTVTARGVLMGSFVGGSTILSDLASEGTIDATLRIARCTGRTAAGFGTRPSGTFAALREPVHMLAADYDSDGRDELLAIQGDGTMAVLDAERVNSGSTRESQLRTTAGSMSAVGDLDLDCLADVMATGPTGVLIVDGELSLPPVGGAGGTANDVAIVRGSPTGPLLLAIASSGGLATVEPDGARRVSLASERFDHVVSWDQNGDGASELAATGPMGFRAFSARTGAFADVTSMLPAELAMHNGPLAVGDLDGDGDIDLVVADDEGIALVERSVSGWMPPVPFALPGVTRIEAVDVTGDCEDDVIALDGDGSRVLVLSIEAHALVEAAEEADALDFAVGDFDAEGNREIAILGTGGRITLWQP